MQFSQKSENCFFCVDLRQFIVGLHLENRIIVRKGILPGWGSTAMSRLRAKLFRSCGERANAGIRRRNRAGSFFGENGNQIIKAEDVHKNSNNQTLRCLRPSLCSRLQQGKVLPGLRRQSSQAAESREWTKTEGKCGQLEVKKPVFAELRRQKTGTGVFFITPNYLAKHGWADEYGRIYLYYPICEVVRLLHCGWKKAVNTLRELPYAELIDVKKQECGKPKRIYAKSYESRYKGLIGGLNLGFYFEDGYYFSDFWPWRFASYGRRWHEDHRLSEGRWI